jgi:hypothetical protein
MSTPRSTSTDVVDLEDSLDIRFLLSGRISPSGIPIRRDRAELATVLDSSMEPDRDGDERNLERNSK